MSRIEINIPRQSYTKLINHLLPKKPKREESLFVFARFKQDASISTFEMFDVYLVPKEGYKYQALYGLELTDATRGLIIKKAHDLDASIVEFHSHPLSSDAEFSPSDLFGFSEFVPHVRWRLKGKPYGAVVVTPTGFDSLMWITDSQVPDGCALLRMGNNLMSPSGTTFAHWRQDDDEHSL